jgi:predicted O-methyltransferase YrrM
LSDPEEVNEAKFDLRSWATMESSFLPNHSYFRAARHIGTQGADQNVIGPMQDDEALMMYALVQTSHVERVLELGGFTGFSARTFLSGMVRKPHGRVYTVDLNPVPTVRVEGGADHRHIAIQKDAAHLEPGDVENAPLDLVLFDCHSFDATRATVRQLYRHQLLKPDTYFVLHDTGLHSRLMHSGLMPFVTPHHGKLIHQPVERLVADWLLSEYPEDHWQRVAMHDDAREPMRHGITIMQRRVNMAVPPSACFKPGMPAEPTLCTRLVDGKGPSAMPAGDSTRYEWSAVLKLYEPITAQMLMRLREYRELLGPKLLVLYDQTDVDKQLVARRLRLFGAPKQTCVWDFHSFRAAYPTMSRVHQQLKLSRRQRNAGPIFGTRTFMSRHTIPAAPMLMLADGLLHDCSWGLTNHTWILEADALFTGDVRTFFRALAAESSDFVSTAYILADDTFWITAMRWHQGVPEPPPYHPDVGRRVANSPATPLPTWACNGTQEFFARPQVSRPAWCDDPERLSALRGWLWRSISVERMSRRLLELLVRRVKEGIMMTGEMFETTMCLSEAWCTLADWAHGPAVASERTRTYPWPARGFRSSHFIFYPSKLGGRPRTRELDVWYHPVKEKDQLWIVQQEEKEGLLREQGGGQPQQRVGEASGSRQTGASRPNLRPASRHEDEVQQRHPQGQVRRNHHQVRHSWRPRSSWAGRGPLSTPRGHPARRGD